jgi:glutathione-dependent formaldehyde-activating enzyme
MQIDGRCHCGFISYEAEIDPEKVMICHCTDCQTLSGSAFRTVALTREGEFNLLSGNVKTYVKIAESGARRLQAFVLNVVHHFTRPRRPMVRRSTASALARAVSVTNSSHERRFGAAQRRRGSVISG